MLKRVSAYLRREWITIHVPFTMTNWVILLRNPESPAFAKAVRKCAKKGVK